jgi:glucokinase
LHYAGILHDQLKGAGIGFGGPVDDAMRTILKSHQLEGWDGFPLAEWVSDIVKYPAVLGNDVDVAGLALPDLRFSDLPGVRRSSRGRRDWITWRSL